MLIAVDDGNEGVIREINFRFCTILFESVALIIRHVTSKHCSGKSHEPIVLTLSEKQSLYYAAGYIVRALLSDSRKKKTGPEEAQYFHVRPPIGFI